MLLSEIVYNIKNLIAGGIESDDENLSNEQLSFIVGYYRARLIKQDQEKGRVDKSLYVQNLGLVDLVEADKNECCEGECILRTKLKIPRPLETYKGLNITFVGNSDGLPYDMQKANTIFWNKSAKYTGKEPKWYYQNGYIYIINPPSDMLETINIQGIFEDPSVAEKFRVCDCEQNEGDCTSVYELDYEYPLPLHLVDTVVKLVAETELRLLSSFPTDLTNDSVDQVSNLVSNARR